MHEEEGERDLTWPEPVNDQCPGHLNSREGRYAGYPHTAAGNTIPEGEFGYLTHTIPVPWYREYPGQTTMLTLTPSPWPVLQPWQPRYHSMPAQPALKYYEPGTIAHGWTGPTRDFSDRDRSENSSSSCKPRS